MIAVSAVDHVTGLMPPDRVKRFGAVEYAIGQPIAIVRRLIRQRMSSGVHRFQIEDVLRAKYRISDRLRRQADAASSMLLNALA